MALHVEFWVTCGLITIFVLCYVQFSFSVWLLFCLIDWLNWEEEREVKNLSSLCMWFWSKCSRLCGCACAYSESCSIYLRFFCLQFWIDMRLIMFLQFSALFRWLFCIMLIQWPSVDFLECWFLMHEWSLYEWIVKTEFWFWYCGKHWKSDFLFH